MWKNLARTAMVANAMVWFGLAFFGGALAVEIAPSAFAGGLPGIIGWSLIATAAILLAALGLIENRNIRSKMRHKRDAT